MIKLEDKDLIDENKELLGLLIDLPHSYESVNGKFTKFKCDNKGLTIKKTDKIKSLVKSKNHNIK